MDEKIEKCAKGIEDLIISAVEKREEIIRSQQKTLDLIDNFLLDLKYNSPNLAGEVDKLRKLINESSN